MSDYTFHIERFDQTYAEMEPLYRQHFAEMQERKAGFGIQIGEYALDTEGYFSYAASGQLVSYIARCDGKPVGYAHIYFSRDHRTAEIIASEDSLFVLPEHRNGTGRKLVQFVLDELRKTNVCRLETTVAGDPRVALLLRRMGFKQTAVEMTIEI
jgi:GNAT superfamily N-acetyltransferase